MSNTSSARSFHTSQSGDLVESALELVLAVDADAPTSGGKSDSRVSPPNENGESLKGL